MAIPDEVIWQREPHTAAKHQILEWYLQAWFPIVAGTNKRVVYFEGFAGPGEYEDSHPGSPLVALDVALEQRAHLLHEVVFVFVEADERRADHLRALIENRRRDGLPDSFQLAVECGEFESVLSGLLDELEADGLNLAPTFAFIDPFGFKGLPMRLIHRLLSYPKTEAFINFAIDPVNRFLEHPDEKIRAHMVDLFGTEEVPTVSAAGRARYPELRKLYQRQLKEVAQYVRFFTMLRSDNQPIYDLFFASNHPLGLQRMKEAMWRADPEGAFRFSDATDPDQAVLFGSGSFSPDYLLNQIIVRFGNSDSVRVYEIEEWTISETPFLGKHMREALKLGEERGAFSVASQKHDGSKRRAGTFPPGAMIDFTARPPEPAQQGSLF